MIESPEIRHLIEKSRLLRGVSDDVLEALFSKVRRISLKQGDRLLSPDRLNENVYLIISGRLSVQVDRSTTSKPLALLNPGDCVGEMSVLVDGMVSAHVVAATDCELFSIDYATFWWLIDGSSEAARNMLNILVYRIRLGNEVIADSLVHGDQLMDNDVIDRLTGLYNYHGLRARYERLIQRCRAGNKPLSMIVLEIDGIDIDKTGLEKWEREQYLRTVAHALLNCLRPDDYLARLIGKKFAVMLPGLPMQGATAAAERLRTAISQARIVTPDGHELSPITISAGISEALSEDSCSTVVSRSEMALGKAILGGRNRVETTGEES